MSIQGKTIVFTGKISKPRHEFQKIVEDHSGINGLDVSRNTDYLVVGEKPGSKLFRATEFGVQTISEGEFMKLLEEPREGLEEVPATPEELKRFEEHTVTLTCAYCGDKYKQWNTLPNYQTCPVCEILSHPLCPHCGNTPTFVEDFGMYHCLLCGTWFNAPHSISAYHTKHFHFWIKERRSPKGIIKTCPCGTSITLSDSDIKYKEELYEEAPSLVKKWNEEREERNKNGWML